MTPASPKIKTAARVSPYRLAHSLRDWAHGSGSSQAPVELRLRRLGLDRDARRPTAAEVRLRKTRQAVHEKWLAMTAASRRGPVAPTHPRLSEYLERWLNESVRPNLALQAVANYEFFSRAYIDPDLGPKRIDRLTVRDVRLWMNDLRVRCQCCAQGKDARRRNPRCCAVGLCCRQIASEWTRHQAWTVLQSALTAAVRDELVSRNVAALVKVPVPRAHRARVWTVEEARTFLESARAANDPFYAAYVLMLVLRLRRGEILAAPQP